jgi:class 3 adenylate cyclase
LETGDVQESEELREITRRWSNAFLSGDADAMAARLSRQPGVMFWGSDQAEEWRSADEMAAIYRFWLEEELGVSEWPSTGMDGIEAFREGDVGWAWATFGFIGHDGVISGRCTIVFHLERDDWRIVHFHTSVPIPNEDTLGVHLTARLDDMAEAVRDERPDLSAETSPDGTVTIVFTDIEDSTRLTQALGDRAWLEILRAHNDLICGRTAEHKGTVVKGSGDGYMLAFSSARRALACSIAIQRAIAETFDDPGSPIRVRIGVHTGEVLAHADDFYGTAVNQAARVASAASGGQIFTSGLVRALVEGDHDLTFRDGPDVELKGLSGIHRLYELAWDTAGAE